MFFIIMIKALLGLFVVGMIGFIVLWIKENMFSDEEKQTIKKGLSEVSNYFHSEVCSECGEKQRSEWNVCPYCGKEKNIA